VVNTRPVGSESHRSAVPKLLGFRLLNYRRVRSGFASLVIGYFPEMNNLDALCKGKYGCSYLFRNERYPLLVFRNVVAAPRTNASALRGPVLHVTKALAKKLSIKFCIGNIKNTVH
jgi:hypothetical protein